MPNTGKTYGEFLRNAVTAYTQKDTIRADYLRNQYIPMMRGLKPFHFGENIASRFMTDIRLKLKTVLQDPVYLDQHKHIPGFKEGAGFLAKAMDDGSAYLHESSLSSWLTEQLYQGTLGSNIGSSAKNLVQSVVPNAAVVGVRHTFAGHNSLRKKLPALYRDVKEGYGELKSVEAAFEYGLRKNFPEFTARHLEQYSKLRDISYDTSSTFAFKLKSALEKGKELNMAPFMGTEMYNRLSTWEIGKIKARADGMTGPAVYDFASTLIHFTQTPGGISGTPHGTLNLNPALRQFSQYTLRQLDLLWSSLGWTPGKGKKPWNIMGANVNLGTVGRLMAGAGVAYSAGKNLLNLDLNDALIFGSLPTPQWEGSPFYPMPLVPPALSMAGGVVQAIDQGDYSKIPRQLAMLVPGGLAAHRAYRTLSPEYAHWKEKDELGRVPIYDDKNRLITKLTPAQLLLRSMGIQQSSSAQELDLIKYLLKQREMLSAYRAEFTQATLRNDIKKAEDISADYAKRYPQLPPLQMKKTDVVNYRKRQELTRVQRTLATLPSSVQPVFRAAVAATLGLNPELLTGDLPPDWQDPQAQRLRQEQMLSQVPVQSGLLRQRAYPTPTPTY
jgi:hypothetical protein